MIILTVKPTEQIRCFETEAASNYFKTAIGEEIVSVKKEGAFTLILTKTQRIIGRIVEFPLKGILLEHTEIKKMDHGTQGSRVPALMGLPGPIHYYCYAVRKARNNDRISPVYWLYNYPLLKKAMRNPAFTSAILEDAEIVIWDDSDRAEKPRALKGWIVDPERLREKLMAIAEDERLEHEFLISENEKPL